MIEILAQAGQSGILVAVEQAFPPLDQLGLQAQVWAIASMPALVTLEFCAMMWDRFKANGEGLIMGVAGVAFMAVLGMYLTNHIIEFNQYAIVEIQTIGKSFIAPGQPGLPVATTPDEVYAIGDGLSNQISNLATSSNWFTNQALSFFVFIAGFSVQMAYLALALEVLISHIVVPFAVSLASIFVGCVVCRFTRGLSAKYVQVIISGLIFSIVVGAMIGIGVNVSVNIIAQANAIDHNDMRTTLDSIAASGLTFFFFVCAMPTVIGVLGGHFAMGRGIAMAATVVGITSAIYSGVSNYFKGGYGQSPLGGGDAGPRDAIASLRNAS